MTGFTLTTRVTLNNFGRVKAGMEQRAGQFTRKAALDIQAAAASRAPVDTGFLRNSIQAVKVGPAFWRVTVGAEYGLYVEYGTRYMGAQPYFFPAIAQVGPTFVAAMRGIVG